MKVDISPPPPPPQQDAEETELNAKDDIHDISSHIQECTVHVLLFKKIQIRIKPTRIQSMQCCEPDIAETHLDPGFFDLLYSRLMFF